MPRDDPPIATPPAAVPDQNKPLRSRHEAFCQHFVLLGNAADAASKAGYAYEWARNQGYRLMRQPRIQARVAEIRSGLASAYCLDAGVLLGKLEAVYQRAVCEHNFHAAARCVEIQARIAGYSSSRDGRDEERSLGNLPGVRDRDTDKTTNDDISAADSNLNRSASKA